MVKMLTHDNDNIPRDNEYLKKAKKTQKKIEKIV